MPIVRIYSIGYPNIAGPNFRRAKGGAGVVKKAQSYSTTIPNIRKTQISIFIDNDVLQEIHKRADAAGLGSQTMMNEALRKFLGKPYRVAANGFR